MSEQEDELELQAIQRRLDDAFATTRPRPGFEDELWTRMQARRPAPARLRDALAGLWQGVREVPAVPAAAVAAVLIVAIGAGFLVANGFNRGGASSTSDTGAAFAPQAGSAQAGSFGRLPSPALASGGRATAAPNQASSGAPTPAKLAGPVRFVWSGTFSVSVTQAPVFRYREPGTAVADAFAASLGAALQGRTGGSLGTYTATDYTLSVRGTVQAPPQSPAYFVYSAAGMPPIEAAGATPADLANLLLAEHSLVPTWQFTTVTESAGGVDRVRLVRQFAIPGYGEAALVDAGGQGYGTTVELRGNQPVDVVGLLPLALDTAPYPIIGADQAVRVATASSPAPQAGAVSVVQLTTVELAYVVVPAGDHSFYEPVYLFTGSLQSGGVSYVEHVMVPAVDPTQRS